MQVYKQTLPDTCLPSCLMMYLSYLGKIKEGNIRLEVEILTEGGSISRLNRTFGHLLYICEHYQLNAIYTSENQVACNEADRILKNRKNVKYVDIQKGAINSNYIKDLLKGTPVIVGVDNYVFNEDFHFPHFVIVEKFEKNNFQLIEPWRGERLNVNRDTLDEAINKLSDYLLYWKELITFN